MNLQAGRGVELLEWMTAVASGIQEGGEAEGGWRGGRQNDPECCLVLDSIVRADFEPVPVCLTCIPLVLAPSLGEGPSFWTPSMGQSAFPGLVGLVFQAGGRVGEELAEGEGFM